MTPLAPNGGKHFIMASQTKAVGVGLLGLGTIGTGVAKVLRNNADVIEQRLGFPLRLVRIADLDTETDRHVDLSGIRFDSDGDGLLDDFEILYGFDPSDPDENTNGILDGLDDSDADGLSNTTEAAVGTDPTDDDSDDDSEDEGDEQTVPILEE